MSLVSPFCLVAGLCGMVTWTESLNSSSLAMITIVHFDLLEASKYFIKNSFCSLPTCLFVTELAAYFGFSA